VITKRFWNVVSASIVVIALLVSFLPVSIVDAWSDDPTGNTPICTTSGNQTNPQIISDGQGGAIITWDDLRSDNGDIYAQKLDSGGTVQWAENGAAVCTASGYQGQPQIASDGFGGAIITWSDSRSGSSDIYAQRLDSSGVVKWAENGVAMCTASGNQSRPEVIPDTSGGAIITWSDSRGTEDAIYAQKVSSGGNVQWNTDGVIICTSSDFYINYRRATTDGSGGVIIAWAEYRSDSGLWGVYAQRLDSGGAVRWTAGGVAICTDDFEPLINTQIVSDGAGGAVIAWGQPSSGGHCLAQKLDSNGTELWSDNGVFITGECEGYTWRVSSDGSGGVISTWVYHAFHHPIWRVLASRVDGSGVGIWSGGASRYEAPPGDEEVISQSSPDIVSDGSGGAIVTWAGDGSDNGSINAQRVDSSGDIVWNTDTAIRIGSGGTPKIASDGSGEAIITWADSRNGNADIYAQRVDSGGNLGGNSIDHSISGTVTLSSTGLQGVTVTLSGAASASASTDAFGNYTFAGLVDGSYAVTPSMSGYTFSPSSSAQVVSGAHIKGVNFTATPVVPDTHSISGTVTLGSTGLQGVTMTLSGDASATTTTDGSGNYTFSGLGNGSYTLTPSLSEYTFNPSSSTEEISGSDITGVNFAATRDETAPTLPQVTDDGESAASTTEIHAAWGSSDPESGIVEYQYAFGTSAGGTDVLDWTSAGMATEKTITGLSLTPGQTYYVSVKALNGHGLWSEVGSSNGISVPADDAEPASEKEDKAGVPFWVWIIVGVGGMAVIATGLVLWRPMLKKPVPTGSH
jgi:hypothetical protein